MSLFTIGDGRRLPGGTVMEDHPYHLVFDAARGPAIVELACIDASTTIRSFRDGLRWNAAWFHLARGV